MGFTVYRLTVIDPEDGCCLEWYSTRTKAEFAMKKKEGETWVDAVFIPNTKKALIGFLNIHLTKDNG
jgi:hypothetical protein